MHILPFAQEWRQPGDLVCADADFSELLLAFGPAPMADESALPLLYFLVLTANSNASQAKRGRDLLTARLNAIGDNSPDMVTAFQTDHVTRLNKGAAAFQSDAVATLRGLCPADPMEQQPAGLSIHSAADLQKFDLPPVYFVVDGLLPQGLALLASPPKFGKSWAVLDLCCAVASGGWFLGKHANQSPCLYLALEDSDNRLQSRLNKVLNGKDAPHEFYYATAAPGLANGLIEQLEGFMQGHPDTRLIVVDTFQKIRSSLGVKVNAYGVDYADAGALKSFADKHSLCLLLVHHLRKMQDDSDPFNRISGTSGILGAADTALVLTRDKRSDAETLLSITGRDVDEQELVCRFDKTACRWEVLGDAESVAAQKAQREYADNPLVKTILKLVQQRNPWEGRDKDIMEACHIWFHHCPADSSQQIAKIIDEYAPLLFEHDRISHKLKRNGSGGGKIHVFKKIGDFGVFGDNSDTSTNYRHRNPTETQTGSVKSVIFA